MAWLHCSFLRVGIICLRGGHRDTTRGYQAGPHSALRVRPTYEVQPLLQHTSQGNRWVRCIDDRALNGSTNVTLLEPILSSRRVALGVRLQGWE